MNEIVIKVLKTIPGHKVGASVSVPTDAKGTPLNKFWRDRLRDAATDNCIEISKSWRDKKQTKKQSSKETS